MKKYDEDYFNRLDRDFINNKITYDEYVKELCIFEVGEENFSHYDLAEHDLYIYCCDDTIKVIRDFY